MLFWKAKEKRLAANEVIAEALLECKRLGDAIYIEGLLNMAYELGCITANEKLKYSKQAKELAAENEKREG